MKKSIIITAVVILLAISLIVLAGCGGKLSGKYELVSVKAQGVEMAGDGLKTAGMDGMYIEFVDGSKFKMTMMGETAEGTYELEGKTLKMTVDGDTAEATIDGKKITMDQEGVSMTFEKK